MEEFCRVRREEGYVGWLSPKAMAPLVAYLGRLGVVTTTPPDLPRTAAEELIERYVGYLVRERGVAPDTVRSYVRIAGQFLSRRPASELGLDSLTTADVAAFLTSECPRLAPASAKALVTGLRSLLRFVYIEGETPTALASAVPSAAGWRLASLPKAIDSATVARLVASCDQQSVVGLRDLAVLMVLTRLGLRAGEVAGLNVGDIDWRNGEVWVRGKGNRKERLPLPADVGSAVVDWLRGRPRCECSRVFTTLRAPCRPLTSGGISAMCGGPLAAVASSQSERTACATRWPPSCCEPGPVWARSGSCSATTAPRPPPSTPRSIGSGCHPWRCPGRAVGHESPAPPSGVDGVTT